jgi:hypothetical protein
MSSSRKDILTYLKKRIASADAEQINNAKPHPRKTIPDS